MEGGRRKERGVRGTERGGGRERVRQRETKNIVYLLGA